LKQTSDGELVARTRAGQKKAFGTLIERYLPLARRIALDRVQNKEVAQELAQEAMVQAYLSLDHLRSPDGFKNWLSGIVLNVCRSHLRHQKTDAAGKSVGEFEPCLSPLPDPQAVVEAREQQQQVLTAVGSLSQENREVVLLFYYEQHSLQEIATALDISVAAVKGRLHKARKQLRARLLPLYPDLVTALPKRQRRKHLIRVTVLGAYMHPEDLQAVNFVLLADEIGHGIRIYTGEFEAWAISYGLEKSPTERPRTLDFMAGLLQQSGATLEEVRIETLKDETFYAIVSLRVGDQTRTLDARPSDAIALAVRLDRPIFVASEIMAETGAPISALETGMSKLLSERAVERLTAGSMIEPETQAIGIAQTMLERAITRNVSEMLIEPGVNQCQVRCRVGDAWQELMPLAKSLQEPLTQRLKMMAELDIAQHEAAQEGTIPVRYEGRNYQFHVTCRPAEQGESLTLSYAEAPAADAAVALSGD
jgi:RNA polymerase sigma factor (sigma-70 family)